MKCDYPIILDFEASGLASESYPIQVAILIDGDQCFDWFIQPMSDWDYWDLNAEAIHGYSRPYIIDKGVSVKRVAAELNERLDGHTVFSDAAKWDRFWLGRLYEAANLTPSFELIDLSELLSRDQLYRFNMVFEELVSTDEYRPHHAEDDVKLIFNSCCRVMGLPLPQAPYRL